MEDCLSSPAIRRLQLQNHGFAARLAHEVTLCPKCVTACCVATAGRVALGSGVGRLGHLRPSLPPRVPAPPAD